MKYHFYIKEAQELPPLTDLTIAELSVMFYVMCDVWCVMGDL